MFIITHKIISFLLIISIVILAGCTTVRHLPSYEGEPLPRDQVAFIDTDIHRNLQILTVDGKTFTFRSMKTIKSTEVLPGKHTFEINWRHAERKYFRANLWLIAEAGKKYIIRAKLHPDDRNLGYIWFEDSATNKPVGGSDSKDELEAR